MKSLIASCVFAALFPPAAASAVPPVPSNAERAIESAYLANDGRAIDGACSLVSDSLARDPGSDAWRYLEGFADYAKATHCRFVDDRDGAEEWLGRADQALRKVRRGVWLAEADAFDAYVLTQLNGMEGGAGGEERGAAADARLRFAVRALPRSPRVLLFFGLCRWLPPPVYGGDRAQGLASIRAAVAAFATEPAGSAGQVGSAIPDGPRWGRADALGWLGTALKRQGDLAGARDAWREALRVAPNYWLVKVRLLPSVTK